MNRLFHLGLAAALLAAPVTAFDDHREPVDLSALRAPEAEAGPQLVGPKGAAYLIELKVKNVPQGTAIIWDVSYKVQTSAGAMVYVESADVQSRVIKAEQALLFAGPKGFYKVRCRLIKGDDSTERVWEGEITAGVAPAPPVPPGPEPAPEPKPKPTPPDPVQENPFGNVAGLRVMVVYEAKDANKLPVGQFLVIQGQKFRDYVEKNCAADGYRMFDKDVKPTAPNQWWEPAMKRTDRTALPWLYVGHGRQGYSGPLPADVDATIAIVNKYLTEVK